MGPKAKGFRPVPTLPTCLGLKPRDVPRAELPAFAHRVNGASRSARGNEGGPKTSKLASDRPSPSKTKALKQFSAMPRPSAGVDRAQTEYERCQGFSFPAWGFAKPSCASSLARVFPAFSQPAWLKAWNCLSLDFGSSMNPAGSDKWNPTSSPKQAGSDPSKSC